MIPVWTLEEAVPLLKELREVTTKVGFAVALAGSILYRGTSTKDLDIVVFPLRVEDPQAELDLTALKEALEEFGLCPVLSREAVTQGWRKQGSLDTKHVEVWQYQGRRVDLLFLR